MSGVARTLTLTTRVDRDADGLQRVLGIDPGLQRTGFAVLCAPVKTGPPRLVEAGVVRLTRGLPLAQRLVELETHLTELVQQHRPRLLACEELYAHYRHPRTAILMAHARGVILWLAARAGLQILPVAATNVKKLLTGSGRAGKRQVQLAVTHTLNLPQVPEPNDVADAIAIGLTGLALAAGSAATDAAGRGVRA
jgi:crossover junction endodeoxyribonuclease RuvC